MTRDEFLKVKDLIFRDIEREIQLAKTSDEDLTALGITPGGGNILAALGLLCYTEFAGRLLFGDTPSANFNQFFDRLGPSYEAFRNQHNVYEIFRTSLAHEYFVSKSCIIAMLEGFPGSPGLSIDQDGRCWFVVESYCRDLKAAFEVLQVRLCGE
jgi:hypothetical protein